MDFDLVLLGLRIIGIGDERTKRSRFHPHPV